jgi:hypothetical protein
MSLNIGSLGGLALLAVIVGMYICAWVITPYTSEAEKIRCKYNW